MTTCKRLLPLLSLVLLFVPAVARAEVAAPQWTVTSVSRPTNFAPGDRTGEDEYVLTVTNTGGSSSDGSPVTVTDELPGGLSLDPRGAFEEKPANLNGQPLAGFRCSRNSCSTSSVVVPGESAILVFPVDVLLGEASSVTNVVRVSGGGAPGAFVETPTTISTQPASFGVSLGGASTVLSSVQAGAHADLTTSVAFNTVNARGSTAGDVKNVTDDLPPGFAGDLVDTPACQPAVFLQSECPVPTQVGVTTVTLTGKGVEGPQVEPVYNLAPSPGDVARLGFAVGAILFFQGNVVVRPGDYGLETTFFNASEGPTEVNNVSLTIWGSPSDPIHDPLRYENDATGNGVGGIGSYGHSSGAVPVPFFTNPTACTSGPLTASISVTSWQQPEPDESPAATGMELGPLVGCDRLGIEPVLSAVATTNEASSPSGLNFVMNIPQTYENPGGLATSTLKQAVVTLPEGMTVNPSAGAGLAACGPAQYAEEGVEEHTGQETLEGHGCPSESKLGTVEIVTPSLSEHVKGSVYLAQPYQNPFGSLIALYVVARIPDRGVLVKVAGKTEPNEATGQLVTTFDTANAEPHSGLPPLPFSQFTFEFNQGATAPLVSPPACGQYTVEAALTPYSNPTASPLTPEIPSFPITRGPAGGACPAGGVPPFNPGITAGTLNNAAGSYSPLDVRITRNDGEQEITGFAQQFPLGLTANLTGVPYCSEAAITLARSKSGAEEEANPSCPAASQIGHLLASAGVGKVLAQAPGKIYLAGPYEGAPFSAVAITSAKVGPFDLGTVVVHLPLDINPVTAGVSIPAGAADQIPHIIKGIVIHVREIRVYIDKQNFTVNPTNCAAQTFAATVIGGGANPVNLAGYDPVTVTNPFQAADCANLKFEPKLTASTSGRTSKVDGASLHVDLTYPTGALGRDVNIREVKVDLPEQLPSRLSTLQKACTAAQFNANPAGCPAASAIGTARAITPILPVALEGPAYFVSHGGEAFPDLEIVLQGDGVTIVLTGNTFISKAGITSSTFKTVPDQPVTSFELTLPEGKYSALAANGNLCAPTRTVTTKKTVQEKIHGKTRKVTKTTSKQVAESLSMPTEFTGQNGALVKGISTPITVTGCTKAKPAKKVKQKKGKDKTR